MPVIIQGNRTNVPDLALRAISRKQAREANQVYEVIFPEERQRIEAITRLRSVQNMNWIPGMTVEDLLRENEEYGVK